MNGKFGPHITWNTLYHRPEEFSKEGAVFAARPENKSKYPVRFNFYKHYFRDYLDAYDHYFRRKKTVLRDVRRARKARKDFRQWLGTEGAQEGLLMMENARVINRAMDYSDAIAPVQSFFDTQAALAALPKDL